MITWKKDRLCPGQQMATRVGREVIQSINQRSKNIVMSAKEAI